MEPWELRKFIEDILEKQGLYKLYEELCQKVEVIPVSRVTFLDSYIDIVEHREDFYKKAIGALDQDRMLLLDTLEKAKAPVEDLVSVETLPPTTTVTLNKISDGGVICLYVLFPNGPDGPYVIPAHISNGKESTFI